MDRKAILLVVLAAVILWWLWKQFTMPILGEKIPDMGRNHLEDISGISYNSNPPTSGPHFPVWAKRGVYDRVLSDGYLVHSLEHGYVVISYNCEKQLSQFPAVWAHDSTDQAQLESSTASAQPLMHMNIRPQADMGWVTADNPPEAEVQLPDSFQTDECKQRVRNLAQFLNDFARVVIVPRPGLDVPIALTAWNRLYKLNSFDREKIKQFIQVFHNRGPEKTQE